MKALDFAESQLIRLLQARVAQYHVEQVASFLARKYVQLS